MQLLFDEQLSEALVRKLADVFPNALHVRLQIMAVRPIQTYGSWPASTAASWSQRTATSID